MAQERRASRGVMVSSMPLRQTAGATRYWDGRSGVGHDVRPPTCSGPVQRSSFQAQGPPATGDGARPYWTTGAIGLVPSLSRQAIAWEQEAAHVTFDLNPIPLTETVREATPRASGELVWGHGQDTAQPYTPAVHRVLMIHGPYDSRKVQRVMILPSLPAHDSLLQHLALVLQVALEGQGVTGQLYAESLADALVVHFLKRYAAARPSLREVTGGLSPSKLRRMMAFIQVHLAQALSLATLAAVAQTSPAHFARLFKHATGLAPQQYVIRCRMVHARRA
jgi:Bacterial regulatory helix-turn-helix proteins, AraC family